MLKLSKQNRKTLRGKNPEVQLKVMREFLSKFIIVDWKGLTDDKEEFKFSIENAEAALKEDQDFYTWVLFEADNINNFEVLDDSDVEDRAAELKK